jgi:hypothetical protein
MPKNILAADAITVGMVLDQGLQFGDDNRPHRIGPATTQ